ncbi:hypothetical protein MTR_1g093945 [Medicago truncatula]|uniref:Uncharacterized protein n=1 Tax=Medicago truncatula TaxID=3880 RepID=A0A072VZH5_MEDTR|nr:hypothetical protein MTR_1g093945 [Medicago truncatula]
MVNGNLSYLESGQKTKHYKCPGLQLAKETWKIIFGNILPADFLDFKSSRVVNK